MPANASTTTHYAMSDRIIIESIRITAITLICRFTCSSTIFNYHKCFRSDQCPCVVGSNQLQSPCAGKKQTEKDVMSLRESSRMCLSPIVPLPGLPMPGELLPGGIGVEAAKPTYTVTAPCALGRKGRSCGVTVP